MMKKKRAKSSESFVCCREEENDLSVMMIHTITAITSTITGRGK